MENLYVHERFNAKLFAGATTITCREMTRAQMESEFPYKIIQRNDNKQLTLKIGESVLAPSKNYKKTAIVSVFTVS